MTKKPPANFIPNNRKPKAVGDLLNRTFRSLRIKTKVERYAAFPRWEEVVGSEIAAVAIPEKIVRGNVLQVRVKDAVWAQELQLQKEMILENLHKLNTGAAIQDIKFSTGNPRLFEKQGLFEK